MCFACGASAQFSIMLVVSGRLYLPNQHVRDVAPPTMTEVWFCADCIRAIEDNLNATIGALSLFKARCTPCALPSPIHCS